LLSEQIDNVIGMQNCSNKWADVYEKLFTLTSDLDDQEEILLNNRLGSVGGNNNNIIRFIDEDILSAISKLGNKKSLGPDKLCEENYKFCDLSFVHVLTELSIVLFPIRDDNPGRFYESRDPGLKKQ